VIDDVGASRLFVCLEKAIRRGSFLVVMLLAVTVLPYVPAYAGT